jgi:hypothetical protein
MLGNVPVCQTLDSYLLAFRKYASLPSSPYSLWLSFLHYRSSYSQRDLYTRGTRVHPIPKDGRLFLTIVFLVFRL